MLKVSLFVCRSLCSLSRHSVEEEFPHLYAAGCNLRDVCSDCTKFVADVISSSRRSLDFINNTPKRNKRTTLTHPHPTSQPHTFLSKWMHRLRLTQTLHKLYTISTQTPHKLTSQPHAFLSKWVYRLRLTQTTQTPHRLHTNSHHNHTLSWVNECIGSASLKLYTNST